MPQEQEKDMTTPNKNWQEKTNPIIGWLYFTGVGNKEMGRNGGETDEKVLHEGTKRLEEVISQIAQEEYERGIKDGKEVGFVLDRGISAIQEEAYNLGLKDGQYLAGDLAKVARTETLREVREKIEKLEIDTMRDGFDIEESAKKFGIPVSVAAIRILDLQKEELLASLEEKKDECI